MNVKCTFFWCFKVFNSLKLVLRSKSWVWKPNVTTKIKKDKRYFGKIDVGEKCLFTIIFWFKFYVTFLPPKWTFLSNSYFMEFLNVFHDFDNQNLIIVMYLGSFFNASNTDTSSYFKRDIFGSNSGWTFTNLQTNAPRVSDEITLFQQKHLSKKNFIKSLLNLLTVRIWYCD